MPLKPLPQPSFTVVSPDRHWEQAWSDYMQGLDGYLRNELGVSLSGAVQSGSAIALTNNAPINITSITLGAGDWDVSANASFSGGATTTVAYFFASTSTTSATLDTTAGAAVSVPMFSQTPFVGAFVYTMTLPVRRFSVTVPTIVYLVVQAGFSVSTCSAFGQIHATRVR